MWAQLSAKVITYAYSKDISGRVSNYRFIYLQIHKSGMFTMHSNSLLQQHNMN
jgi:hypothetical protein